MIRLAHFSLLDWGRVLLPLVAAITIISTFVGVLAFSFGKGFWGPAQYFLISGIDAAFIWLATVLLATLVLRRRIGVHFSQNWPLLALWSSLCVIWFSAKYALQSVSELGGPSFWAGLFQFVQNTQELTQLANAVMINTGIGLFVFAFLGGFFQITNYYPTLANLFNRDEPGTATDQNNRGISTHVVLEYPDQRQTQVAQHASPVLLDNIPVDTISYIEVKVNFRTVIFERDGQWKEWGSYGSLKEIEQEFPERFLKISRSILINPEKIQGIQRNGRQYQIRMPGRKTSFLVSRSLNKSIRTLQQERSLAAA